jgi:pyruvate/2-oxoacid:ferredoxin oxidoreductase alpha subunit
MSNYKIMEGNESAAWGVKLARVEVIPAYPITPQTELITTIASLISKRELDAEYIKVEGEHTAMAASIGASIAGARVFTASSSQGLLHMEEPLWMPGGMRLPIVMCMVNRSIAPLGTLRPDHNDSLLQRDNGWIQIYCENSQEVLDSIIQAYKIAEDPRVYLPVAICYDGYFVSATASLVNIPEQKKVDEFLPPYKHQFYSIIPGEHKIPKRPQLIAEARYQIEEAMERARHVIEEVNKEYSKSFGRDYDGLIEEYKCEDAEGVIICMGSITGTARDVIDEMQEKGFKIGLIKLRIFRPFPKNELNKTLEKYKAVGIIDRNTSYGSAGGGIVVQEIARAMYSSTNRPMLIDFHVGLGGSDVTMNQLRYIIEKTMNACETGKIDEEVNWVELKDLGEVL